MSVRTIELLSTHIGQPKIIATDRRGKAVRSSIDRQLVAQPELYLTWTGLAGDQPTDTRPKSDGSGQLHGGNDKAVYVYPREHYAVWRTILKVGGLGGRSFGENWSIAGLTEAEVHVGDIWECGEAQLEVSKPRQPCQTLVTYFDNRPMIKLMAANGLCGWYLKVLRPGVVPTSGLITVVSQNLTSPTIAAAFAGKMRAASA